MEKKKESDLEKEIRAHETIRRHEKIIERKMTETAQGIFDAIERNDLGRLKECLRKNRGQRFAIKRKNKDGKTPLDVALDKGYLDIVKWITFDVSKDFKECYGNDIAIKFYKTVLNKLKDGDIYLDAHLQLGQALYEEGEYIESTKVLQDVYNERKDIFGLDHCRTAVAGFKLAVAFRSIDDHLSAFKLDRQVYYIAKTHLGFDHPRTLSAHHNMALDLQHLGKNEMALKNYEEVLRLRKEVLGSNHRETKRTENNIAIIHDRNKDDGNLKKLKTHNFDIDDSEIDRENPWPSTMPTGRQELFDAVEQNDLDRLKICHDKYCCMLVENDDGKTPLDVAAGKGYFDIVDWYVHVVGEKYRDDSKKLAIFLRINNLYNSDRDVDSEKCKENEERSLSEVVLTTKGSAPLWSCAFPTGGATGFSNRENPWLSAKIDFSNMEKCLWPLSSDKNENALKMYEGVSSCRLNILGTDHLNTEFSKNHIAGIHNRNKDGDLEKNNPDKADGSEKCKKNKESSFSNVVPTRKKPVLPNSGNSSPSSMSTSGAIDFSNGEKSRCPMLLKAGFGFGNTSAVTPASTVFAFGQQNIAATTGFTFSNNVPATTTTGFNFGMPASTGSETANSSFLFSAKTAATTFDQLAVTAITTANDFVGFGAAASSTFGTLTSTQHPSALAFGAMVSAGTATTTTAGFAFGSIQPATTTTALGGFNFGAPATTSTTKFNFCTSQTGSTFGAPATTSTTGFNSGTSQIGSTFGTAKSSAI